MTLPSKNIVEMFLDVAQATPHQIAIELDEQTWTYAELLINVIYVARNLQIKMGEIVYQYVDRSFEMVCGLLGIMYAGGAYCPLSPSDPPLYIRALIDGIQARYVLVHEKTQNRFSSMVNKPIQMIHLDHILLVDTKEEVVETKVYVKSDSPSFVICTSGTTGRKNPIVHTHVSLTAGIHNLMSWSTEHGDKVLQVVPSSWNIHLFEILMSLVIVPSGTLVLLSPRDNLDMARFCKTIKNKQITILFVNPSLLKMLLDYLESNNDKCREVFEAVRILWISGESLKPQHLAKIKTFAPHIRIFLMFATSETNAAIGREIDESIDELMDLSILPIGSALAEYRCLLVDAGNDGRVISPLDTNKIGQIHLRGIVSDILEIMKFVDGIFSGTGLFQCYHNDPELTSRTRVTINDEEFFQTGDLARYNTKGELVLVVRIDFQTKMDDQRLEIAEVERTVMACSPNEIFDCLVIRLSQDDDALVAYVISDNSQLDTDSIRNYCKDHLREYMVPSYFVVLDKFSLNANGKVDRQQLPLPVLFNNVPMPFVKADEPLSSTVSDFDVCLPNETISKASCRCWSSLPCIPSRSCSNKHCLIMDKPRLTTADRNKATNMMNKNIFYTSLPALVNIPTDHSPIDETDCFLSEYNSCNLDERNDKKLPFPGFIEKAFCCLRQTTPPRYQCLKLITWPWFERISTFIILLNCITLGMYQPCTSHAGVESSTKCDTTLCFWLKTTESLIFAFFTLEMCIKMIAMGIFGKGAYLSETWNRLDCFIVLSGVGELLIPGDHLSLSAIRTVRVLRPLRTINRVPSMRILVMLLLDTLPMLGNVLLLYAFIFLVFGIIGVQLWKGLLRNRCFLQLNTSNIDQYKLFDDFPFQSFYIPSNQDSFICSNSSSSGMTKCSEIPKFHRDNITCELTSQSIGSSLIHQAVNECINWNQYYQLCATSDTNPFSGSISFDNIVSAWLAIFQIITLENWVSIMYYIQDAHSFWDWIYFVCLIVIGAMFMMNICLAVISTQFDITKKRETERMLAEQNCLSRSTSTVTNDRHGSCWEELIKHFQQSSRHAYTRLRRFWKTSRQKRNKIKQPYDRKVTTVKQVSASNGFSSSNIDIVSSTPLINQNDRTNCKSHQSRSLSIPTLVSNSIDNGTDTSDIGPNVMDLTSVDNQLKNDNLELERLEQPIERNYMDNYDHQDEIATTSDNNQEVEKSKCRIYCTRFVAGQCFDRTILSAIIINTLSMSVEYHGQPQLLTTILEYSNYVFTIVFTIEMLFKLITKGCFQYIKNPFDLFDGGIVLISLIELYGAKNSGLSVLRAFRLLRVLRLVQFIPTLRRQLVVMVKILNSVATFFLLLILFVFIFSVLGMHLFGGEFCTLEAFNRTSREQFDMKCRCCACVEWNLLKNSTDLKDLICTQERANFDSLHSALLTVFQILTQEDWNEVLYVAMKKTNTWSALYFIILLIFGNYILVNLLIAILVEGFINEKGDNTTDSGSPTDRLDNSEAIRNCNISNHVCSQTQPMITSDIHIPENLDGSTNVVKLSHNNRRQETSDAIVRRTHSDRSSPTQYFIAHEGNSREQDLNNIRSTCIIKSTAKRRSTIDNSSYSPNPIVSINSYQMPSGHENNVTHTQSNPSSTQLSLNDQNTMQLDMSIENDTPLELTTQKSGVIQSCLSRFCRLHLFRCIHKRKHYSLYLFSPTNRLRKVFQWLIVQKSFDNLILFFIALNSITLAMERPSISPISFERQFLNYTNYIFTTIFTIEMIIKVIASGLIVGRNTYLRTSWNVMDGFLVIVSIVDVVMMHHGSIISPTESGTKSHILGMLRIFRLLRTLRPLRVINRAPNLKVVVQTLLSSLRPIGNVVFICCIFFIIFGILGVQLFKGKFYYCEGPLGRNGTTKQQCQAMSDHRWQNQQYNFDHLGQALLTLFVLSSKDGWVEIMYNGIDAIGVDMQPIRNYSEAKSIYFVSFILIVGFFVVNMFVGVIVENFHTCRAQLEREEAVRKKAKLIEEIQLRASRMHQVSYHAHFSPWRKCLHDLCINKYFDIIITVIIGLNVVTMSLEFYRMPSFLDTFLEYCNHVFTGVFVLEFLWKIVALGPSRYFKDKWNQLDLSIVILSIIGIAMEKLKTGHVLPMNPTVIRVMRVLRIARVLRLLKMAKGIQALINTVIQALPQVGNLGLLFLLLFFIFAALGVELFGKLECSEEQPCSALNKHAHFKNFGMSFLTLFRVSTGDNWSGIMKDSSRQDDSSFASKNYFTTIVSPIYFVVFVLMSQFVLVNILVAVLMKKLEDSNKMIADDADMDEEMAQQLELDTYGRKQTEQSQST